MAGSKPALKPVYRRILILGFTILALTVFLMVFPMIKDLIIVVIISIVLTYVFRPGVVLLDRQGIPRTVAILSIFIVVILVLTLSFRFLIPILIDEFASLIANLETFNFGAVYSQVVVWLEEKVPSLAPYLQRESATMQNFVGKASEYISSLLQQSINIVAGAVNVLALSIVVPFLTFFMLKDGDKWMKKLVERIPNRYFEMTLSLGYEIDQQLGAYIRSILIESLIVWLLSWIALETVGVKFALVLGLINGLLNMIPFFGPLIAYVPLGIVVLFSYSPVLMGLFWLMIILIAVQMVDNIVLKPLLISKSVNVHPAMVLLAVLIGGRLAGAIGMFVAVPAYGIIQVVIADMYSHLKDYRIV